MQVTFNRSGCLGDGKDHRQICFAAALCLVLAVFSAPGLAGGRQAIKSYEIERAVYNMCSQSDALINSKSYAPARDVLLRAASYDPTSYSAYVHLNLAQCYRELGSSQQACREAEAALRFEPDSDNTLYSVALSYYDLNYFDKALHYLNKLISASSEPEWRTRAQTKIAEIEIYRDMKSASRCIKSGRDSEAIRLLERAAIHDPSKYSAHIHANLAYVLRRSGKSEQAIVQGKQALQLDPSDKDVVYGLGIAYQDMGTFDQAISWLRRYVSMETDARARNDANVFIQELSDDRAKLNDTANNAPDYLDQLRTNGDAEMWPRAKLPIKVYVSSAKGIAGYRPLFRNFIIRSLDTWCQVSGKKLNYVIVDNAKTADLNVAWTSGRLMMKENARNRSKAGITYVTSDTGKIDRARISITTMNGFSDKFIEDSESASVSMHEVGHALGLGHSTCVKDVMYFGSSSQQSGDPSPRDRATIARLYADYPVVGFIPKAPASTAEIKYLPPPAFLPPKPPASDKIVPPLFMPPPARTEEDKLTPPLFTPPPLSASQKSDSNNDPSHPPAAPMFVPPPLEKPRNENSNSDKPPFFRPPPLR